MEEVLSIPDSQDHGEPATRYAAFISYSHADEALAARLHRALELYRLPKRLVGQTTERGTIPRRLFPIFRDRDELPGTADLGAKLREALCASRCLIVICSPQAAESKWVNEEIREFQRLGRGDRIFCVIAKGDPKAADAAGGAFPPAIVGEPLAIDLREGPGIKRDARLRLVAGMVGLNFDELNRRDHQRWVRNVGIGSVATVALLTTFAVLSVFGWRQRNMAEARTLAAESVQAIDARQDPVAGLDLAIKAMEKSPSAIEARNALIRALEVQRSLLILQHRAKVYRASFSSDGSRILTCGAEPTARVWSTPTGELLHELVGTGGETWICAFSPDGATVVTSVGRSSLRLWDAQSGAIRAELTGHTDRVATAAFSRDGSRLVSASGDGSSRIWDVATGAMLAVIEVSKEPLRAAFFSADGAVVAVADNGRISVWDAATKGRLQEFGERMPGVHNALMATDGGRLLVSNYQYRPYLWRLSDPAQLIDGVMAMPHAAGAAFSADGALVAVGGGDGFVTVFDTEEGHRVKQLQHPGMVSSMVFSPSGRFLVTAADKIRIWQTPVLGGGVDNEIETLRGHTGEVSVEGFAPGDDSRILTIGVEDHTVRVWDVSAPGGRSRSLALSELTADGLLGLAQSKIPTQTSAKGH